MVSPSLSFRFIRAHRGLIRALICVLLVLMVSSANLLPASARINSLSPQQQAIDLLQSLTPEERVSQLFLITFDGNATIPGTPIYNLITNYHIGGVILRADNDNIALPAQPEANILTSIQDLSGQLQQVEWNASQQNQKKPITGEEFTPAFIPLFIGLSQEGNGYPYDQILSGLTPLPNAMTLGASWNPELAAQVGEIAGKELSSLGINLLLGPSLDVLESPPIDVYSSLGTRTFGGDPYWVSEMGRAYIKGVHQGSSGQLAVISKHFPGHGSSDRLPEEEVATVRKSLEQLISFDLAPFFAVTGNASTPEETTDGLLASHIRYQGLQGNIRATTRPISFDPQALNLLTELPALSSWRQNGGVLMSDDLGSMAVRRFYDLTSQTFDARRVALNASLAGNDLLYVADFTSADEAEPFAATVRTLEFFAQKYREDTAFAQRVDTSVSRILTLKYRLYKEFNLDTVLPSAEKLAEIGLSSQVTFNVVQQAATLISPTQAELDDTIPDPPNQNDRIVFITDVRSAKQCSQCEPVPILDLKAFQDRVIRIYGSATGGQVNPNRVTSYSLSDLDVMMNKPEEGNLIERDLDAANWIVFSMLSARSDIPSFQTLSRFLTERPDLFQQKRLIVFAFCAPYYLDATNISKLTAYYSLYGKAPQFVDVAAYLLFRELRPAGSLPISLPSVGYDLNQALFPDPAQTISLEIDLPVETPDPGTPTPEPLPIPEYRLGDVIPLRTGVILDHNGHPVPDGTPVVFVFSYGSETSTVRQEQVSKKGIARTTYSVTISGALDIHVESENARSNTLQFDIPLPSGEIVPTDTPTPTPSPIPTETPFPTPTQTPQPTTPEPPAIQPQPPTVNFGDWLIALLITLTIAWGSYRLATMIGQVRWGIRAGFLALIGGLLAYSYLALRLPGTEGLWDNSLSRSIFFITLSGCLAGLAAAFIWRTLTEARQRNKNSKEKEQAN
ncbi:MAG: hypothetical protein JXB15_12615 [Anaerolineales bacterium]|nr:hypothetical protein [Anaerolineales bacterium]